MPDVTSGSKQGEVDSEHKIHAVTHLCLAQQVLQRSRMHMNAAAPAAHGRRAAAPPSQGKQHECAELRLACQSQLTSPPARHWQARQSASPHRCRRCASLRNAAAASAAADTHSDLTPSTAEQGQALLRTEPFLDLDQYDGFLFDVDGTLTNSDDIHFLAFQELLQDKGYAGAQRALFVSTVLPRCTRDLQAAGSAARQGPRRCTAPFLTSQ